MNAVCLIDDGRFFPIALHADSDVAEKFAKKVLELIDDENIFSEMVNVMGVEFFLGCFVDGVHIVEIAQIKVD